MLKDVYSRQEGTWESFLNSTDHFNGKGNGLYAEAVASIITTRIWGEGNRRFQFDRESRKFVNIGPG
jgi:hypothetical protein